MEYDGHHNSTSIVFHETATSPERLYQFLVIIDVLQVKGYAAWLG